MSWQTLDEAATVLGLSRSACFRAVKSGHLKSKKEHGRLLVKTREVHPGLSRDAHSGTVPRSRADAISGVRVRGPSFAALDQLELERGRFELENMRAERDATSAAHVEAATRANFEARVRMFLRSAGVAGDLLAQLVAEVGEHVSVLSGSELAATSVEDIVSESLATWLKAERDALARTIEHQRRERLALANASKAATELRQRQDFCRMLLMMRRPRVGR